ncbi:MAG: hypothetical protein S0880_34550 [Actinomycetota bacterium]|nr:hypothetical protein [Actinomycetota bacterium]
MIGRRYMFRLGVFLAVWPLASGVMWGLVQLFGAPPMLIDVAPTPLAAVVASLGVDGWLKRHGYDWRLKAPAAPRWGEDEVVDPARVRLAKRR